MNVITAIVIIVVLSMFFAFLVRIHSINKGRPIPKTLSSQLIDIFAIIPRGFVRELRRVLNSNLKPEQRLNALINVILVILFPTASIVGALVLLVYAPFGGQLCVLGAILLLMLGLTVAKAVADTSIHNVF